MAASGKKRNSPPTVPKKRTVRPGTKPGLLPTGNTEGYTSYSARPPESGEPAPDSDPFHSAENSVYADVEGEKHMSLGDHLEELRFRLLWVIGILFVASCAAGVYIEKIHAFLVAPYRSVATRVATAQGLPGADRLLLGSPYAALEIYFKLSVMIGALITLPIALSLLWGFVTPAVSKKIARIGHGAVVSSTLLFWGGIVFAWVYIFPLSLDMMLDAFLPAGVVAQTSLEKYYSFLFMIVLGSGLTFQLPMVVVILGAIGIVPVAYHKRVWKIVLIGTLAFSGFFTPPDPFSLFALALPLWALYILAVGVVWIIEKSRGRRQEISSADG